MSKLNNLRKPKSNFQIYQQNILVKFKPLVIFLREHHTETYNELTALYSTMMDEVYYTQLKQYFVDTSKLIRPIPKSSDLLQAVERAEVADSVGGTGAALTLEESYLTTSGRE